MSCKKPPFGKTISSDDKNEISNTETQAGKTFGIFDQNHGLTPLEKCKFFDYSKMKGVGLYIKDSLKHKRYLMKPSSHFGSKSKRLYEA